jgi:hypothetical protein
MQLVFAPQLTCTALVWFAAAAAAAAGGSVLLVVGDQVLRTGCRFVAQQYSQPGMLLWVPEAAIAKQQQQHKGWKGEEVGQQQEDLQRGSCRLSQARPPAPA